jgi:hypothetical protein
VLVASLVVASCGADVRPAATVTIPAAAPPSSLAASEPTPASARPAPTPRKPKVEKVEGVGVPECDAYLVRLGECMANANPAAREAWEKTTGSLMESWRQAAASPEARTALAEGCRAAIDALAANSMCK